MFELDPDSMGAYYLEESIINDTYDICDESGEVRQSIDGLSRDRGDCGYYQRSRPRVEVIINKKGNRVFAW